MIRALLPKLLVDTKRQQPLLVWRCRRSHVLPYILLPSGVAVHLGMFIVEC